MTKDLAAGGSAAAGAALRAGRLPGEGEVDPFRQRIEIAVAGRGRGASGARAARPGPPKEPLEAFSLESIQMRLADPGARDLRAGEAGPNLYGAQGQLHAARTSASSPQSTRPRSA